MQNGGKFDRVKKKSRFDQIEKFLRKGLFADVYFQIRYYKF